jgi:hypothetical protein
MFVDDPPLTTNKSMPQMPMLRTPTLVFTPRCPRLLQGAEICGMCQALTDAMQRHVNHVLRCVLGMPRWKSVSSLLPWKEMRTKPICALAASRRARACTNAFVLKTWISQLVRRPLRFRKWTWVTGTCRWISRFCKRCSPLPVEDWDNWSLWDPKARRAGAEEAIMTRKMGIRGADGCQARVETGDYTRFCYELKPLARARVPCDPALVTGTQPLSQG